MDRTRNFFLSQERCHNRSYENVFFLQCYGFINRCLCISHELTFSNKSFNRSTDLQLANLICNSFHGNKFILLIELSTPFDIVNHIILISELKCHRGDNTNNIKGYLKADIHDQFKLTFYKLTRKRLIV